jgi:3-phosphoshikimate 1-carboxyvinyltransferase
MGASIESNNGTPPLRITGKRHLRAIDYAMPVASAQVKSAVLLAGLYVNGTTGVTEPAVTRDHTERMLGSMGVRVAVDGARIGIVGGQRLTGCHIDVPGDLSSATFLILAAVLAENAELVIQNVGINPTRTGVIDILQSMGADIVIENPRQLGEEPVADLRVRSSLLHGTPVDPALVSLAIDEFPALFVAAAAAAGKTVFSEIGELRVKESDRIGAMATALRALGIQVDESPDGATVHGGQFTGGSVDSHGDHRVAMAMAVAGTVATGEVRIGDVDAVDTSFPGFANCLAAIGANISPRQDNS